MKNKTQKAYSEILKVLKKHKDTIVFDVDTLETKANIHLFGIELKEKHGLNINPVNINSLTWQELRSNICIGLWGQKYDRTISWSDDGRQPKDELLLCFKYPTGAYIFGEDYPEEFFQKFFLELKTYNPKYIDTHNHSLYFSMDNAGKIFNEYESIYQRYNKQNEKDIKERKIRQIKKELLKLES